MYLCAFVHLLSKKSNKYGTPPDIEAIISFMGKKREGCQLSATSTHFSFEKANTFFKQKL